MTNLINQLAQALEVENEKVTFVNEDSKHYYFNIEDEFFTGLAKVEKAVSTVDEYSVEFKEEGSNVYRGNGIISVA